MRTLLCWVSRSFSQKRYPVNPATLALSIQKFSNRVSQLKSAKLLAGLHDVPDHQDPLCGELPITESFLYRSLTIPNELLTFSIWFSRYFG